MKFLKLSQGALLAASSCLFSAGSGVLADNGLHGLDDSYVAVKNNDVGIFKKIKNWGDNNKKLVLIFHFLFIVALVYTFLPAEYKRAIVTSLKQYASYDEISKGKNCLLLVNENNIEGMKKEIGDNGVKKLKKQFGLYISVKKEKQFGLYSTDAVDY